ncbi:protein phosphatase Slingshot homolog 2-like isoform X2 [Synchiropus splendidus]|uniref:protein phosphatase Slingshot homolog 2-like isoform X2 n=1 Tax=Synchiropus splendidus TaxID=270530 RepID=UPI00237D9F88|nr:protein phosphatase Slingshot homolog 2-like isoform X2 [Synchiropus splendidus]
MALVTVQRSPTPSTSSSPCVSESGSGEDDRRSQPRSISESFLTVKGAALFLPRGNGSTAPAGSRFSQLRNKHAGDIQQHLQTMFTVLRPEDNIKLAVRLESAHTQVTRYMVVVSTNGRQDTEESVVLGVDFSPVDSSCSVGMVLPLWSDTLIHLDGDGGFSVSTDNRIHVFKPVSVQAMWSALQSLHKACEVARSHNYFPGSLFLTWVSYYQSRVSSDQARINEWNAMQDVQSHRADSPVLFSDAPTERELTERQIKTSLKEIMMLKDLENVTCKEIRTELEMHMTCNLREFKEFIDNEMIVILGQMDSPTEIFDHVFLGSEWNASNLEELQKSGVQYILNVTREIDNFFPGVFEYHNIRVYDEEATDLLAYWNDTYKFISRAKKAGSKCLVHCKMGISRSAATVIAYAMKEFGWDLSKAFHYVKERRAVTKPNPSFMRQLEEYQGILLASKQRHNKLWRSHSDSDLSEHHEPLSKSLAQPHSLGRSDPHNQSAGTEGPSVKELLESLATAQSPSQAGARPVSAPAHASLSNGVCESAPPRSQSRAAALVPEPPRTDRPSPSPHPCSQVSPKPTQGSVPAHKPNSESGPSPDAAPVLQTSDFISNSSAIEQDGGVLFGHGGDHINFFSAREKFKGMTRDGRSQSGKNCWKEPVPEVMDGKEERRAVSCLVQVAGLKPAPPPSHDKQEAEPKKPQVDGASPAKERDEEETTERLYSDWTRGSVRRATRQLEQKLKKRESPSPSSSPPSLTRSSSCSQWRPAQGQAGEETEGAGRTGLLPPAELPDITTSTESPFTSVSFLCLEGVTELESGTDLWPGPPSCDIMRETWETLCELGAFLQQVSVGGACRLDPAQKQGSGGGGIQGRVREVEARIRQAGLTPPSLMKRSASLAKLGCLEKLANELSEWELSRACAAPPAPPLPTLADDSKKQRVQGAPPAPEEPGTDSPATAAPRQQYGRTHPLRRLKKRTVSALYHTM